MFVGDLLHGGVVEDVPTDVVESSPEQLGNSRKNENVLKRKKNRNLKSKIEISETHPINERDKLTKTDFCRSSVPNFFDDVITADCLVACLPD